MVYAVMLILHVSSAANFQSPLLSDAKADLQLITKCLDEQRPIPAPLMCAILAHHRQPFGQDLQRAKQLLRAHFWSTYPFAKIVKMFSINALFHKPCRLHWSQFRNEFSFGVVTWDRFCPGCCNLSGKHSVTISRQDSTGQLHVTHNLHDPLLVRWNQSVLSIGERLQLNRLCHECAAGIVGFVPDASGILCEIMRFCFPQDDSISLNILSYLCSVNSRPACFFCTSASLW